MIRRLLAVAAAVLISVPALHAEEWLSGGVDLDIGGFYAFSSGWVQYDSGLITSSCGFSGTHAIHDGGAGIVTSRNITGCEHSPYNGTVTGPAVYSHCYQAVLDVYGQRGASNTYPSATRCAAPAPGGGSGEGDGDFQDEGGSPIVINLARGGAWQFADATDPVLFDLDADGTAEHWTWTARGSHIAFLALDRNRNGRVDDGRELFGDQAGHANGFELLKMYDSSGDGRITRFDAIWPQLLLWLDADHDGISVPDELSSVAGSGIEALDLNYHWNARVDRGAAALRYQSLVHLGGPAEPYFDVFFRRVR